MYSLGWSWRQLKTSPWTAWCVLENSQRFYLASLDLYFHFIHSDGDLKQFYEYFGEGGFQAAKGFLLLLLLFIFQKCLFIFCYWGKAYAHKKKKKSRFDSDKYLKILQLFVIFYIIVAPWYYFNSQKNRLVFSLCKKCSRDVAACVSMSSPCPMILYKYLSKRASLYRAAVSIKMWYYVDYQGLWL